MANLLAIMTENETFDDLFNITSNISFDGGRCVNNSEMLHTRRLVELGSAVIGGILSSVDLTVLAYLQYKRKGAAVDFLLTISVVSILVLIFYGLSCFPDLCWFGLPYSGVLRFWHDYLWMFTVNTLFCAYGYLIVVLIIDRYVLLHYPIYYGVSFVHTRVRLLCILGCLLIGALCNMKWILLEPYSSDDPLRSERPWFKVLNGITCIVQYFLCGLLMIWFSYKNSCKSKELSRLRDEGFGQGTIPIANQEGQRAHEIVARICVIFTVTYIILNWPYGIYDYMNNPRINNDDHVLGALFILINFNQTLYLQPNLFIFAYSSRLYRNTLICILKYPFVTIARCFGVQELPKQSKISEEFCDSAVDLISVLYHCS